MFALRIMLTFKFITFKNLLSSFQPRSVKRKTSARGHASAHAAGRYSPRRWKEDSSRDHTVYVWLIVRVKDLLVLQLEFPKRLQVLSIIGIHYFSDKSVDRANAIWSLTDWLAQGELVHALVSQAILSRVFQVAKACGHERNDISRLDLNLNTTGHTTVI